jgi:phosphopantothenoylcysteine decarboxylase/phosphopantothenate--cysteine ligase
MTRILITSGPTRQYIDPVRYLTNASSGRMGAALAEAALAAGCEVVLVSGPVQVEYPSAATVIPVVSTEQMLEVCCHEFLACDGLIAAAAPCDYRPQQVAQQKIAKTGDPLLLELIETPDIVAALASRKRDDQWFVGFALETNDQHIRALVKLEKKSCDLMVLNGPQAIDAETNHVEIMDRGGTVIASLQGTKVEVARGIMREIQSRLLTENRRKSPIRDPS